MPPQARTPTPPFHQTHHHPRPPRDTLQPTVYEKEILISNSLSDNEDTRKIKRLVDDDHGLRIKILEFEGNFNHLDDFVDWLHAIERVFEYKIYSN